MSKTRVSGTVQMLANENVQRFPSEIMLAPPSQVTNSTSDWQATAETVVRWPSQKTLKSRGCLQKHFRDSKCSVKNSCSFYYSRRSNSFWLSYVADVVNIQLELSQQRSNWVSILTTKNVILHAFCTILILCSNTVVDQNLCSVQRTQKYHVYTVAF